MSTSVTNVIVFVYLSFLPYDYSGANKTNNIREYVNGESETFLLPLKGFMVSNTTGLNVTQPHTQLSEKVKTNPEFKTKKKNKRFTTPYPLTQGTAVIDADGKHRTSEWTTDDGGHRKQIQIVAKKTTYMVVTSWKSKTRPLATSTSELVPFVEEFKPFTKEEHENVEEQNRSDWIIEETIQKHSLNSTQTLAQDITKMNGSVTTETHGQDITKGHGQETTETHGQDTTSIHIEDTTEIYVQDTTELHFKDTTESDGQDTQEIHRPPTTKTHRHERTFMQEKTQSQPVDMTEAVLTTRVITQATKISSDRKHDQDTRNQETETPYINATVDAASAMRRQSALNGLIWWVAVVAGAGLGMIILLSVLTVMFYRPWRRNQLIEMRHPLKKAKENMYGKIGSNRNSKKFRGIHSKNSCYGKISEKDCGDDERYQRTQSVFSWGTEFDSFDPVEEVECQPRGHYAFNTCMLTQANIEAFNNSANSSAELLGDSSLCYGSSDIVN